MSDLIDDYLDQLAADSHMHRPHTPRAPLTEPAHAPQVSASLLAHAARDAIRDVLPADWQKLPDGRDTANLLAGTLANHYAARQLAQAERLAAASPGAEAEVRHG